MKGDLGKMVDELDGKAASDNPIFEAIVGIDKTCVSGEVLAACATEEDFIGIAVSLLVETGSYCCVAASTLGSAPSWSRDNAAIGGNVVRLYKLISAMLDQTVQRRRETSFVFARLAFETTVSIRFLIKHFSSELIDSYVKHSFKHETRLRSKIMENIANRDGKILPIEDRMIKSIDRSFESAGIKHSDMDGHRERNWGGKNFFEKACDLGLEDAYLGAFAGASHSVHGAWYDVYSHNLETEGDLQFQPKLEWGYPRPQLLFATAKMTIPALDDYFGFMAGSEIQEVIEVKLRDLFTRVDTVDTAHETYLSAKDWPII